MTAVLHLDHVSAGYGPFRALFDVTLAVEPGEAVALLGPNGVGKTTVARVATGLIQPTDGSVRVDGADMTGAAVHKLRQAGIIHAPDVYVLSAGRFVDEAPYTSRYDWMKIYYESTRERAEDYLETVAARLREDGAFGVKTSVWYGAAAPSILEAARMANPDLIMMSTHGRSGIGRLVVGSVAESVLRGTRTPIFLLRIDGTPPENSFGRASDREQETAGV